MASADDDNGDPVPWRADPGRSETRWDPDSHPGPGAPYGQPYGLPESRSPGPRLRWWLLVALGLVLIVITIVLLRR